MDVLIILILSIVLSFIVAEAGKNKSIGYSGALVVSILFSPLIGMLAVAISGEKKANFEDKFKLNKTLLTGVVNLLDVKSYAGLTKITIDNTDELLLVAKRMFETTFDNAIISHINPPDSDGNITFTYTRTR